jgi:hypothetical protein
MSAVQHAGRGTAQAQPKHLAAADTDIPDLLTPGEVARVFRVDPQDGHQTGQSGKLSCIRTVGGHRRYRTAEIRALLAPAPPPGPPPGIQASSLRVPGLGPLESAIMTCRLGRRAAADCPRCPRPPQLPQGRRRKARVLDRHDHPVAERNAHACPESAGPEPACLVVRAPHHARRVRTLPIRQEPQLIS